MIWHHMSTWACGLARGHMERRSSHFGFNTVSWYRWHEFQSWWIVNQEFEASKDTKQSQDFNTELDVVWVGAGCGCGLDRVWIGLDPGLDRPRSGPTCLCMLQLGCSMTRPRTTKFHQAASVQLGCLAGWPYNLQQCQLLSAWQFDSLDAQQLQLGCWTAWLLSSVTLRQVQLGSLTAWQRGFTTVCCLAAWQGE